MATHRELGKKNTHTHTHARTLNSHTLNIYAVCDVHFDPLK